MPLFRSSSPVRTCLKTYKNYRSFKPYLVTDFDKRCGYCNGSHSWFGGYRSFHIDHFAPKDRFSHLENSYTNLVYTCSFCNIAKSNIWPSNDPSENLVNDEGFLDPCAVDYNLHFERDESGKIFGKTVTGRYMVKALFLSLERHAVTYQLSRLENLISDYSKILESNLSNEKKLKAENAHYMLLKLFYNYTMKLDKLNN